MRVLDVTCGNSDAARKEPSGGKWNGSITASLAAPLNRIWQIGSDFSGLHKFVPNVEVCERLKGRNRVPGCLRFYTMDSPTGLPGGKRKGWAKDRLLNIEEESHSYTYAVEGSNMNLENCEVSFKASEGNDGSTVVKWSWEVDPVKKSTEEKTVSDMSEFGCTFIKGLEAAATTDSIDFGFQGAPLPTVNDDHAEYSESNPLSLTKHRLDSLTRSLGAMSHKLLEGLIPDDVHLHELKGLQCALAEGRRALENHVESYNADDRRESSGSSHSVGNIDGRNCLTRSQEAQSPTSRSNSKERARDCGKAQIRTLWSENRKTRTSDSEFCTESPAMIHDIAAEEAILEDIDRASQGAYEALQDFADKVQSELRDDIVHQLESVEAQLGAMGVEMQEAFTVGMTRDQADYSRRSRFRGVVHDGSDTVPTETRFSTTQDSLGKLHGEVSRSCSPRCRRAREPRRDECRPRDMCTEEVARAGGSPPSPSRPKTREVGPEGCGEWELCTQVNHPRKQSVVSKADKVPRPRSGDSGESSRAGCGPWRLCRQDHLRKHPTSEAERAPRPECLSPSESKRGDFGAWELSNLRSQRLQCLPQRLDSARFRSTQTYQSLLHEEMSQDSQRKPRDDFGEGLQLCSQTRTVDCDGSPGRNPAEARQDSRTCETCRTAASETPKASKAPQILITVAPHHCRTLKCEACPPPHNLDVGKCRSCPMGREGPTQDDVCHVQRSPRLQNEDSHGPKLIRLQDDDSHVSRPLSLPDEDSQIPRPLRLVVCETDVHGDFPLSSHDGEYVANESQIPKFTQECKQVRPDEGHHPSPSDFHDRTLANDHDDAIQSKAGMPQGWIHRASKQRRRAAGPEVHKASLLHLGVSPDLVPMIDESSLEYPQNLETDGRNVQLVGNKMPDDKPRDPVDSPDPKRWDPSGRLPKLPPHIWPTYAEREDEKIMTSRNQTKVRDITVESTDPHQTLESRIKNASERTATCKARDKVESSSQSQSKKNYKKFLQLESLSPSFPPWEVPTSPFGLSASQPQDLAAPAFESHAASTLSSPDDNSVELGNEGHFNSPSYAGLTEHKYMLEKFAPPWTSQKVASPDLGGKIAPVVFDKWQGIPNPAPVDANEGFHAGDSSLSGQNSLRLKKEIFKEFGLLGILNPPTENEILKDFAIARAKKKLAGNFLVECIHPFTQPFYADGKLWMPDTTRSPIGKSPPGLEKVDNSQAELLNGQITRISTDIVGQTQPRFLKGQSAGFSNDTTEARFLSGQSAGFPNDAAEAKFLSDERVNAVHPADSPQTRQNSQAHGARREDDKTSGSGREICYGQPYASSASGTTKPSGRLNFTWKCSGDSNSQAQILRLDNPASELGVRTYSQARVLKNKSSISHAHEASSSTTPTAMGTKGIEPIEPISRLDSLSRILKSRPVTGQSRTSRSSENDRAEAIPQGSREASMIQTLGDRVARDNSDGRPEVSAPSSRLASIAKILDNIPRVSEFSELSLPRHTSRQYSVEQILRDLSSGSRGNSQTTLAQLDVQQVRSRQQSSKLGNSIEEDDESREPRQFHALSAILDGMPVVLGAEDSQRHKISVARNSEPLMSPKKTHALSAILNPQNLVTGYASLRPTRSYQDTQTQTQRREQPQVRRSRSRQTSETQTNTFEPGVNIRASLSRKNSETQTNKLEPGVKASTSRQNPKTQTQSSGSREARSRNNEARTEMSKFKTGKGPDLAQWTVREIVESKHPRKCDAQTQTSEQCEEKGSKDLKNAQNQTLEKTEIIGSRNHKNIETQTVDGIEQSKSKRHRKPPMGTDLFKSRQSAQMLNSMLSVVEFTNEHRKYSQWLDDVAQKYDRRIGQTTQSRTSSSQHSESGDPHGEPRFREDSAANFLASVSLQILQEFSEPKFHEDSAVNFLAALSQQIVGEFSDTESENTIREESAVKFLDTLSEQVREDIKNLSDSIGQPSEGSPPKFREASAITFLDNLREEVFQTIGPKSESQQTAQSQSQSNPSQRSETKESTSSPPENKESRKTSQSQNQYDSPQESERKESESSSQSQTERQEYETMELLASSEPENKQTGTVEEKSSGYFQNENQETKEYKSSQIDDKEFEIRQSKTLGQTDSLTESSIATESKFIPESTSSGQSQTKKNLRKSGGRSSHRTSQVEVLNEMLQDLETTVSKSRSRRPSYVPKPSM